MRREALSQGDMYRCSARVSTHMHAWQPCRGRWAKTARTGDCRPHSDRIPSDPGGRSGWPTSETGEKIPRDSRPTLVKETRHIVACQSMDTRFRLHIPCPSSSRSPTSVGSGGAISAGPKSDSRVRSTLFCREAGPSTARHVLVRCERSQACLLACGRSLSGRFPDGFGVEPVRSRTIGALPRRKRGDECPGTTSALSF